MFWCTTFGTSSPVHSNTRHSALYFELQLCSRSSFDHNNIGVIKEGLTEVARADADNRLLQFLERVDAAMNNFVSNGESS